MSNLYLIILAGTPATIAYGGTSFVTTAPAAITAPLPKDTKVTSIVYNVYISVGFIFEKFNTNSLLYYF